MTKRYLIFLELIVFLIVMNSITWASLQMRLSPLLQESYDDNILLLNDTANIKDYDLNSKDDFVHSTGLLFGLDQTSFYIESLLNYYIELKNFSKNEKLNNVRQNASLQLKILPANTLSFDVKNLFKSTEEFDLTISGMETEPFTIIERQIERRKKYTDDFYMKMNYQITGKSILYFDYKLYFKDVQTDRELDENINSYRIGLDFLYGRMNKNKLGLMVEFKDYDFEWNEGKKPGKGFETYSIIAASFLDISYKSKLTFYGGILKTEDKNRDSLINEDCFSIGRITYKAEFNHVQLNLSYDHEISGSGRFGELVEREGIQLSSTAFLNSHFSATISSNFRDNNFKDNHYYDPNDSDSKNNNETLSFYADLGYDNNDKFKATLYYSLFKNKPKEAGVAGYKQSTITLKTTYLIVKNWILKIEYNYIWRDIIGEIVTINDIPFKRNLITIGIDFNFL